MPGTITLRPLTAKLTRDTELFGTMDPYCKIHLGKQVVSGQVCRNGGKHPQWDETLVLKRNKEAQCLLELKEKDWLLPDGVIGTCDINLQEIEQKQRVLKWYPLNYTGRPCGQILLEINYQPDGSIQPVQPTIQPAIQPAQGFTTGQKIGQVQPSHPNIQPVTQIGPGVMHGFNPSNPFPNDIPVPPQNNDFNNNVNNNANQNYNPYNSHDMFAPPVQELSGYDNLHNYNTDNAQQKYPTFDANYYMGTYQQPETIDYRNQPGNYQAQNMHQVYPGVTNEALVANEHLRQEEKKSSGWDPMRIIRGAVGKN